LPFTTVIPLFRNDVIPSEHFLRDERQKAQSRNLLFAECDPHFEKAPKANFLSELTTPPPR
jgi:hypothetical protein